MLINFSSRTRRTSTGAKYPLRCTAARRSTRWWAPRLNGHSWVEGGRRWWWRPGFGHDGPDGRFRPCAHSGWAENQAAGPFWGDGWYWITTFEDSFLVFRSIRSIISVSLILMLSWWFDLRTIVTGLNAESCAWESRTAEDNWVWRAHRTAYIWLYAQKIWLNTYLWTNFREDGTGTT